MAGSSLWHLLQVTAPLDLRTTTTHSTTGLREMTRTKAV